MFVHPDPVYCWQYVVTLSVEQFSCSTARYSAVMLQPLTQISEQFVYAVPTYCVKSHPSSSHTSESSRWPPRARRRGTKEQQRPQKLSAWISILLSVMSRAKGREGRDIL
jgi:hypothetical protein